MPKKPAQTTHAASLAAAALLAFEKPGASAAKAPTRRAAKSGPLRLTQAELTRFRKSCNKRQKDGKARSATEQTVAHVALDRVRQRVKREEARVERAQRELVQRVGLSAREERLAREVKALERRAARTLSRPRFKLQMD